MQTCFSDTLTLPSQYILENLFYIKQRLETFECHKDKHDHNTRYKNNLVPAYWRLRRCQTGPGYWAIKFYNVLPDNVKNLNSRSFKSRVKKVLIENAFYNFDEFISHNFN